MDGWTASSTSPPFLPLKCAHPLDNNFENVFIQIGKLFRMISFSFSLSFSLLLALAIVVVNRLLLPSQPGYHLVDTSSSTYLPLINKKVMRCRKRRTEPSKTQQYQH